MQAAGDYAQRVRIERPVKTRNSLGEQIVTWEEFATVWAAVEPLSGRELTSLRAELADVTARIRIRYRPGVLTEMRIVHGTAVYNIASAIDVKSRRHEIEILGASEASAT